MFANGKVRVCLQNVSIPMVPFPLDLHSNNQARRARLRTCAGLNTSTIGLAVIGVATSL